MTSGSTALLREQHSAYRNVRSSCNASELAAYRRNVPSRRTVTRSSFLSFSRWCERVDPGMHSSSPISPTTRPSGWADSRSRMIRSRGSVPMADIMSANFATASGAVFVAISIFLQP